MNDEVTGTQGEHAAPCRTIEQSFASCGAGTHGTHQGADEIFEAICLNIFGESILALS